MHYYRFSISDYRADTAHLQPMEHYIYRQLIDWYYLDEKPIPKKTQSVLRRLGLGSEFSDSVLNVLEDFFEEGESGWVHHRIERDIAEYKAKSDTNAVNGRKGGRPKKQQLSEDEKPKKTQSVFSGNRNEPNRNPNHLTNKPLNQEEKKNKQKKSGWEKFDFGKWPSVPPGDALDAVWKIRKSKKQADTQKAVDLLGAQLAESVNDGFTLAECMDEWVLRGWGAFKAEWMRNARDGPKAKPKATHGGFDSHDYTTGIGEDGRF